MPRIHYQTFFYQFMFVNFTICMEYYSVCVCYLSQQETHIIHPYNADLYGKQLKLCISGYLRPEKNFDSLESLIAAINEDIRNAQQQLDTEPFKGQQFNEFFKTSH